MKASNILYILLFCCFAFSSSFSQSPMALIPSGRPDTLIVPDTSVVMTKSKDADIPLVMDPVPAPAIKHKRSMAAALAFPLPFGILGLHRVYLGTKPYMPIAYMATIGGCFGILPLIDFIAILSSKKETLEGFKNNPNVFMWTK